MGTFETPDSPFRIKMYYFVKQTVLLRADSFGQVVFMVAETMQRGLVSSVMQLSSFYTKVDFTQ